MHYHTLLHASLQSRHYLFSDAFRLRLFIEGDDNSYFRTMRLAILYYLRAAYV